MEKPYEPTPEELREQEEMSNLAQGALELALEYRKSMLELIQQEGFGTQDYLTAYYGAEHAARFKELENNIVAALNEEWLLEYLAEDTEE